ncbi:MAG: exo-alpha-sialidase [Verrucomicrobiales bacterium]|nr:exo-alpha-sialidase [Verrucomicrobiales bacterium]
MNLVRCLAILLAAHGLSLAADADGQAPESTPVFTAGDGGYRSIRIPSIVTTGQGTLLAFAEGRGAPQDQAGNDLLLRRSRDGGRTWEPLQVVQEDGAHSLNNPTAVVDHATGRIFLMYQRIPSHLKETSRETAPGWEGTNIYRNLLTHSDDDGKTWSPPCDLTRSTKRETTATTIASGPGAGIQLRRGPHAGRLIIPFNEGPYHQWNNYAVFSDDHGDHWTTGANAPGARVETASSGLRSQINEVQMVELSDGSVRLNSRPFAGAPLRKTAISRDGGETWSPVEDVPELPDPSCNAAILRVEEPRGGSPGLIVFCGPLGSRRERGTLHASWDDGRSWPRSRLLRPGFFAYSALTPLPGGGIGCLFEAENYARIEFVRIPSDWFGERP